MAKNGQTSNHPTPEQDDPIVAEYDMYIDADPPPHQLTALFQFPHWHGGQLFRAESDTLPTELRLKKRAGFVEIDVPMHRDDKLDLKRASEYGSAMQKAQLVGVKAHGVANGYYTIPTANAMANPKKRAMTQAPSNETGAASSSKRRKVVEEEEEDDIMRIQTYGGRIGDDAEAGVGHLLAEIRGDKIYLRKLDELTQLHPQTYHVDVKNAFDRVKARLQETNSTETTMEPKLVQMRAKKADDKNAGKETVLERLKTAHDEKWIRFKCFEDEDDGVAIRKPQATAELASVLGKPEFLRSISHPESYPALEYDKRRFKLKAKRAELAKKADEESKERIADESGSVKKDSKASNNDDNVDGNDKADRAGEPGEEQKLELNKTESPDEWKMGHDDGQERDGKGNEDEIDEGAAGVDADAEPGDDEAEQPATAGRGKAKAARGRGRGRPSAKRGTGARGRGRRAKK